MVIYRLMNPRQLFDGPLFIVFNNVFALNKHINPEQKQKGIKKECFTIIIQEQCDIGKMLLELQAQCLQYYKVGILAWV